MQRHQSFRYFITSLRPENLKPRCQRIDRPRQGLGIKARLRLPEPFRCPSEYVPEIFFSRVRQTDRSSAAVGNHVLSAFDVSPPSASAARSDRLSRSVSAESYARKRPAAMPASAASRMALRRISSSVSCRSTSPETLAHHFTGILIAAGRDQPRDQGRLMIREDDVARRHDRFSLAWRHWHNLPTSSDWQGFGRWFLELDGTPISTPGLARRCAVHG